MNPNSILPSSLNPISTTTNPPRTLSSPFPLPDAAPFAQPPSAVQDVYATKSTAGKKDKGKARIRYGYGPQLGGARKWNEDEFEDLDSHGERGPIGHDQSSPLLTLPPETLLQIASCLPPSSLLSLLLVCTELYDLASSDVAWRLCFEHHFTSVETAGLVRSCQAAGGGGGGGGPAGKGWKREALAREKFLYQTAHSRNPTLIHDPRLGHVASFALSYPFPAPSSTASKLSSTKALHHESTRPPTLLTASLLHGVCSRSEPLSGKVLKGYISDRSTTNDPTGAGGLGLPSVTAMLLKEKDSSRILWGYVDGEVAVTSLVPGGGGKNLPKGVRSRGFGRIGARSTAHGGAVRTLAGGKELFAFASGGDDGTVKLWREAGSVSMRDERLECIWTGQVAEDRQKDQSMLGMPRDAIAKVCWDGSSLGCVTASGEVRVWIGFSNGEGEGRQRSLPDGEPIVRWRMPGEGENYRGFGGVGFEMDSTLSPQSLSFLVHLADSSSFIKLSISFPSSISPPDPSSLDPTVTAIIFRSQTDDLLSLPLTAFFTDFALPPTISLPFAHRSTPLASRPPSEPSTPSVSSSNVFHLPNTIESQEPIKRQGALGSSPYVVAGDAEGFVRVWAWNASPIQPSFSSPTLPVAGEDDAGQQSSQMLPFVLPIRDFLASPYSANSTAPPSSSKITFLTCSSSLLLVGTLEGSILIYDPLPPTTAMNGSPTLLRSFNERRAGRNLTRHLAAGELDPSLWQVSQITLERDLLVAAVGARILGWRIGDRRERDGKSPFKGKVLGRKAVSNGGGGGKSSGARSGHTPHEIHDEIVSARLSHRSDQASIERQRTKADRFAGELGGELTETEQLEYILMLSQEENEREEDERRRRKEKEGRSEDEHDEGDGGGKGRGTMSEEDLDEELMLAMERSLLDIGVEQEYDEGSDYSDNANGGSSATVDYRSLYPFDGFSEESASYDQPQAGPSRYVPTPSSPPSRSYDQRSSFSSSPNRHHYLYTSSSIPSASSADDRSHWPSMPSSPPTIPTRSSSTTTPSPFSLSIPPTPPHPISSASPNGKKPSMTRTPMKAWNRVASSPAASPLLKPTPSNSESVPAASISSGHSTGRHLTAAEREEEELRKVLELSLLDS